ncbi:hypothetical protein [Austwickia chelonae]|uniref:hypothetical protein n=1 Tax=Austwickia chelonae TaxID=100225 RepID=UPI000E284D81|nr:hypothetical protein [Austwickia chelonae]
MSIAVHRPGRPERVALALVSITGKGKTPDSPLTTSTPIPVDITVDDLRIVDALREESAQLAARLAGLARLEAEILSL